MIIIIYKKNTKNYQMHFGEVLIKMLKTHNYN